MARIAIVLASDFEDSEFDTPRTSLLEEGHTVDVIGTETQTELTGKQGDVTYTPDLAIGAADPDVYDALVIPGGYSPDKLRTDAEIVDFVKKVHDRRVPVAAVCHAGSLLIEADVVRGRHVTSWPSISTDLKNAGAQWTDEEVVVDGNLITSRKPDDLPAFTKTLIEMIDGNRPSVGDRSEGLPYDPAATTPTGTP